MAIDLYSGTPGSGKSLHLARKVSDELALRKKNVIANFPINMDLVTKKGRRKTGEFIYLTNDQLTVDYLREYARQNHKVGKEGQTLVVIDEAGIMFNSRDYGAFDRKSWINFFMTHRHFGYNIILVSQIDRLIDRQIRGFIEYEVKHRKANNFRFIGLLLTIFRIPLFVAVTYWYGMRERCSAEFFRYRKKDSKLYDTMMLFGGDQHGMTIAEAEEAASAAGR
jgi:zona occludens toxin (predicted ATPase)